LVRYLPLLHDNLVSCNSFLEKVGEVRLDAVKIHRKLCSQSLVRSGEERAEDW
jgi:hypothetical protein